MVKNCEIVYKSKAPAWAKARPSQAQLLAFSPAHNFFKPELPKARPKLGLSGQAGADTSLIASLDTPIDTLSRFLTQEPNCQHCVADPDIPDQGYVNCEPVCRSP